jgi:molecular chaperone GrpE (heat shock protein)
MMLAFEKAGLAAVAGFSGSAAGRFWLQFLILLVVAIVAGVLLWDRAKAIQHNRNREAAEDFDTALDAKDALVTSLNARVCALEAEAGRAKEREERLLRRMDMQRARSEAELEDVKRTLGARIAMLESRLEDFECVLSQTCKKRRRPSIAMATDFAIGGTE